MKNEQLLDYAKCMQIANQCTCMHIRKASRAITQYYESFLAPVGLTSPQFTLIVAVALMHEATVSTVAENLGMDRTTLSRNLKPLLNEKLVLLAEGADRRTKCLTLTEKGRTTLIKAIPLWQEAQEKFVKQMGQGNWKDLLKKLSATVVLASNLN